MEFSCGKEATKMGLLAIAGAIIVAIGLAALLMMLPDIKRYVKMRSM
jgi:hypothetical protein